MKMSRFRWLIIILAVALCGYLYYANRIATPTQNQPGKEDAAKSGASKSGDVAGKVTDAPKDSPKDSPKEGPKEGPKDGPKDGPKESPKDGPKESPKEGPKESPKEDPLTPYTKVMFLSQEIARKGHKRPHDEFVKLGGKISEERFQKPIKEMLKEGSPTSVQWACRYIGAFQKEGAIFVPDMIAVIENASGLDKDRNQQSALWALTLVGPKAKEAIPAIANMVKSEYSPVRKQAYARAVSLILTGAPLQYSPLAELEKNGDELDRQGVALIFSVFDRATLRAYELPANKGSRMQYKK